MSDESSTFNVFAAKNGYSIHFKLSVNDVPRKEGQSGLAALMSSAETLIGWMKEHGYEHDATKDRPFGGGRAARPEVPAPSDIPVPQHCGVPMKYRAKTEKAGAKYECAKGSDCENAREYNGKKYGATVWEDAYRRELEKSA